MRPIEVPISHEERHAGQSKYSMYSLIRLNFDLITGFSVVPLQLFSMAGMAIATALGAASCCFFVRRIIVGPEAEGLFTLFGIVFFLIGMALFGIGLLGEYVGRIYAQVRERPRLHRARRCSEHDAVSQAEQARVERLRRAGVMPIRSAVTRGDRICLQRGRCTLFAGAARARGRNSAVC